MILEIHLADHCNLKCSNCNHFSQIAEEKYLNPDDYENNLKKINKDILNYFDILHLIGGEPLLNKDIIKIIKITRKYFYKEIRLVTNGILLNKMSDDFYKTIINENIIISFTKYPINLDYEKILSDIKEKYGYINIRYHNNDNWHNRPVFFLKNKINIIGDKNFEEKYNNCIHIKEWKCVQLVGTKLYICSYSAYINNFNKKYGYNLEDNEYLDLSLIDNINDIINWFNTPKVFCKHCNIDYEHLEPWSLHNKNINDYD